MNLMSSVVPSGKSQIYNRSKATPLKVHLKWKYELNWTKCGPLMQATVPGVPKTSLFCYVLYFQGFPDWRMLVVPHTSQRFGHFPLPPGTPPTQS